jgi:hypothetical protein
VAGTNKQFSFSCDLTVFASTEVFTIFPMPLSKGRKASAGRPQVSVSIYRPHVLAVHRIPCWTSPAVIVARARLIERYPELIGALTRAQNVAVRAWEDTTKNSYGAGLGRWAEWCDACQIGEDNRMPISKYHLACFITDAAGSIGMSGFDNWMSGLRAWHVFHDMQWCGDDNYVQLVLKGAKKLAPTTSKHQPRLPVQFEHLEAIYDAMDFMNSYDAACWAVACSAFWGLARLGEITVSSKKPIDPMRNVQRKALITWSDCAGVKSVTLRLPWTKTSQRGADLILTFEEENAWACPYRAIQQHLSTNQGLPDEAPFFAFRTARGWEPMVKRVLMDRFRSIWMRQGLLLPSGHSFCIGGTTYLLSRGTNPQVVQKLGRWSSDAFYLYWRNTQLIIPSHVRQAAATMIEAGMKGYFDDVAPEAQKRWREIQASRKKHSSV